MSRTTSSSLTRRSPGARSSHLCVSGPDGRISRAPVLAGGRAQVRARAVAVAMHLVRELLGG